MASPTAQPVRLALGQRVEIAIQSGSERHFLLQVGLGKVGVLRIEQGGLDLRLQLDRSGNMKRYSFPTMRDEREEILIAGDHKPIRFVIYIEKIHSLRHWPQSTLRKPLVTRARLKRSSSSTIASEIVLDQRLETRRSAIAPLQRALLYWKSIGNVAQVARHSWPFLSSITGQNWIGDRSAPASETG